MSNRKASTFFKISNLLSEKENRNMYIKKDIALKGIYAEKHLKWQSLTLKRLNYGYLLNLKYISKTSKLNYIPLNKQSAFIKNMPFASVQICFVSQLRL